MFCRTCGVSLYGDESACPACFADVVQEPRRLQVTSRVEPAPAELPAETPGPDGEVTAAAAEPVAAIEPNAPRCPVHTEQPVVGTCSRCGSFLCRTCTPAPEQPWALCAACQAREAPAPEGIGGWLILPAIGFTLSPVVGALSLWQLAEALQSAAEGFDWTDLLLEIVLIVVAFVYSLILVVAFYLRKRVLPLLAVGGYAFNAVAPLLLDSDGAGGLVRAFVVAAIWIPYFLLSERVKRTFVR
jgi:hypothetical protein